MPNDAETIRRQLRITCADALVLMTEYLEEALSPEDLSRFHAHLAGCEACAIYLDQLRSTVRVTGTLSQQDTFEIDPEAMDHLVHLYRATRPD